MQDKGELIMNKRIKRELPVKCKVYLLNALTYTEKAKEVYEEMDEHNFDFLSILRLEHCLIISKENILNLYNYCNMRNYRKGLLERLVYLNNDFKILLDIVQGIKKENGDLEDDFEECLENVKIGIEDIVYNRI